MKTCAQTCESIIACIWPEVIKNWSVGTKLSHRCRTISGSIRHCGTAKKLLKMQRLHPSRCKKNDKRCRNRVISAIASPIASSSDHAEPADITSGVLNVNMQMRNSVVCYRNTFQEITHYRSICTDCPPF